MTKRGRVREASRRHGLGRLLGRVHSLPSVRVLRAVWATLAVWCGMGAGSPSPCLVLKCVCIVFFSPKPLIFSCWSRSVKRMARGTKTSVLVALVVATLLGTVFADTYMHNPRGSNNRLNERSANRANGNRMFDSQVESSLACAFTRRGQKAIKSNERLFSYRTTTVEATTKEMLTLRLLQLPLKPRSRISTSTSTTWYVIS